MSKYRFTSIRVLSMVRPFLPMAMALSRGSTSTTTIFLSDLSVTRISFSRAGARLFFISASGVSAYSTTSIWRLVIRRSMLMFFPALPIAAIGKAGKNINMLRRMTSRQIEVVEYAETPEALIKNSLAPARLKEIRVTERSDKKIVVVEVDPRDKAIAIGKNGRTIDKTRMLVKRYFDIDHVVVS